METLYTDYAPKGVKFYYLYKALAHPELNGYVKPFSLKERLMHVKEAQRTLGSKITWLCDGMANDVKHALGNRPNSEFVMDPDGKIVRMRTWSDPAELRRDLEALVGPVANPTRVADLKMATAPPPKVAASGVVPRVDVPERMTPVRIEPQPGDTPFYAKLRVEVTREVLRTGSGRMYVGFHMDPIYHVHWNNLAEPLRYTISSSSGTTVTPASGTGPKVDVESDIDPREFLVDVENGDSSQPLELTVQYFACNDAEGWCIPVTQQYAVHLVRDPDGGGVQGRSFGAVNQRQMARRGQRSGAGGSEAMISRMLSADANGDGKLSREEAPEQLLRRFDRMDQNEDGFVDEAEMRQMAGRQRQGRRGGRGGQGGQGGRPGSEAMISRMLSADTNGDGKLSREEAPEQLLRRFDRMDQNGDGFVDEAEMRRPAGRQRQRGPGGDPVARLMAFDKNGDGKLSREELPEQFKQRFDRMDANEDGFLDKEEVMQAFERRGRGDRQRPAGGSDI